MARPVPNVNPKTKDTNLDARRSCGLWRMSLLGVYAYDWAIEYVCCCRICRSFAARDPPVLFPTHAVITNIVPTAGPMRAEVPQGVRTHSHREIVGFSECGWHAGSNPGVAHRYRSDNIGRI